MPSNSPVYNAMTNFWHAWGGTTPSWCDNPKCTDIRCLKVRKMARELMEMLPGRDAIVIEERILPTAQEAVNAPDVTHIISRHGIILGRCLQGSPSTWPPNHWVVMENDAGKCSCIKCLDAYDKILTARKHATSP